MGPSGAAVLLEDPVCQARPQLPAVGVPKELACTSCSKTGPENCSQPSRSSWEDTSGGGVLAQAGSGAFVLVLRALDSWRERLTPRGERKAEGRPL